MRTPSDRTEPAAPARPLRALFVSDHLGMKNGAVHGVTTYFLETLPAFDRSRVEAALCILQPHHPAVDRFAAEGITPIFLGRGKWDPRAFVDLLRLLRRFEPDVLHLSGEKGLLFGRLAARLVQLPVVAHFHDMLPGPRAVRALQRRLVTGTQLALANSQRVREYVLREFATPPERTLVLYNGLNVDRFARPSEEARARVRAELGLAATAPAIGVLGRVHPVKGQKAMIRALPRVLGQCPEAVLLIVGEGPDREACVALTKQLGLGDRVRFTGQRDDIPDVLAAVDVSVVPSLWEEPFGLVALEAMAAGRPVVAFRIGGLPESIEHGESGLLVAPGEVDSLAEAVVQVLTQPQLAARLAAGASRRAQEFSIRRHVQRLEEIYTRLCQGSHHRSEQRSRVPPLAAEGPPPHRPEPS